MAKKVCQRDKHNCSKTDQFKELPVKLKIKMFFFRLKLFHMQIDLVPYHGGSVLAMFHWTKDR